MWWLDGIRADRRDRRGLAGATRLVALELERNIGYIDVIAQPGQYRAGAINAFQIVTTAWGSERSAISLQMLPRELIARLTSAYTRAARLEVRMAIARGVGDVSNEDVAEARAVKSSLEAALEDLRTHARDHLKIDLRGE